MIFYRYDDSHWSDATTIDETKYYLVRETKCGYWVKHEYDNREEALKFVLKSGRKRLCYPSKEEALISYLHRKRRRAGILNSQLAKNKRCMDIATKMATELNVSLGDKNESYKPKSQNETNILSK
jgi:hypothetical protein